jgi:membrane-associated HD superfamily phosphohydrolase
MSAIVGVLLSLLFSFSSGFQMIFEEGQKWQYDDLYAPKQMLVPLSKEVVDSLSKNSASYTPVFQYNTSVLVEEKAKFTNNFQSALNLARKDNSFPDVAKNSKVYLQFGEGILGKIYEKGILQQKIKTPTVKIMRGDLMTEVETKKVFDVISAYNFITDTLPYSALREPEFLLNSFDGKLKPNLVFDETQNEKARLEVAQLLQNQRDTIKQGDLIIKKGRKITTPIFNKLQAFKDQNLNNEFGKNVPYRFLTFLLFTVFCLFVLTTHFSLYQADILKNKKIWFLLLGAAFVINIIHYFSINSAFLHPLATPFLALPILFRKKINIYAFSIYYIITVIIASQITPMPYPFVVALIMSGFFMAFVQFFDQIAFGKIWLTLSSLSILAFVYYNLSYQQHIVFDPMNILVFIGLHGVLALISDFLNRFFGEIKKL